jgi:hypothetical protein
MASREFAARAAFEQFPAVWQRVITDPLGFFAEMPETGGLAEPGAFLALCAAINALGHLLFMVGLGAMLGVFLWQLIAAVVLAAFLVVIAQNLFAGRGGFEPTFRVIAYAWAPLVVGWVPFVGGIALLYTAYLVVRGLERVQGLDTARAVLSVVVGAAVLAILRLARFGPAWY